ncbi:restriction endonuclease subunit S [Paenibacillus sp. Y412MC10]|uniref:restriction endonuclease subunit S n=1 Tax=Geobacillus sp. (strain Y412MC10) TaxID=481743 RepID=UPI000178969C|nr:restriction endonuclease subunit S [Paenibacillus sp. Y412MC10]ACX63342.1 restriction modification system DNA specificity domain protein [Paenibacillus sp. Y412MC10]
MNKWEKVRLGDVCEVIGGSTPKTSVKEYWDGEILWITPAELNDTTIIIRDTQRKITDKAISELSLKKLPVGTVLLSSRAPIGKVAITGKEMYCNQGFKNLVCSESVFNKYLFWFLKGKGEFLNSLGRGATFKEISKSIVENIVFPLPPLEVQKQIAATLDAASELLTMRKQQLSELDELIKSVFYEMFGDPVTNEKGWILSTFGNIGVLNSGGTPSRSNNSYFKGSINWFSAGELNQRYLLNSNEKITQLAIEQSSAKIFKAGSLLIGMYDTAAFKLGILAYDAASNQACANIQINEQLVNIEWLYDCARIMRPHFLSNRRGVRQKNLNLGMIKNLEIPLPPLDLQIQFADIVTKIEEQKTLVKQAIDETQQLFDSLMSQYFDD